MAFLGFGKKDKIVDLGERYRRSVAKETKPKEEEKSGFGFLAGLASSTSSQQDSSQEKPMENQDSDAERKQKLSKMLSDMSRKLEDLSIQLYHLQQRVELLEIKAGVKSGIN